MPPTDDDRDIRFATVPATLRLVGNGLESITKRS